MQTLTGWQFLCNYIVYCENNLWIIIILFEECNTTEIFPKHCGWGIVISQVFLFSNLLLDFVIYVQTFN